MRLAGKTAFITGGSSGIGLATARLFITEGAKVAITGIDATGLRAAAAELGPNLVALEADVRDPASMEKAVAAAVKAFGKLDVVFANAGIGGGTPVGQTDLAVFDNILRTNVTAVFSTIQAAAPHLNEKASIILNGSIYAVMGLPGLSAFAASKGAVRSMTRVLASEFAPRGIRVNQVTPGPTRTPVWNTAAKQAGSMAALEEALAGAIPMARMNEAEEVAKAVLFLASSDSSSITADEIVVDGGATGAPLGAPVHRPGSPKRS